MDSERMADGRQRLMLGPVEKWVAGVVALAAVTGAVRFGQSLTDRLDRHNTTLQAVVTQQAVTNGKVDTLTTQLADVPRLTRDMAETKVRVERVEHDVRELQRRNP